MNMKIYEYCMKQSRRTDIVVSEALSQLDMT